MKEGEKVQSKQQFLNLMFLKEKNGKSFDFPRADEQTRTADLLITNEVRYHLCHVSLFSSAFSADAL